MSIMKSLLNSDQPAASRYAATNLTLLDWFKSYNEKASPQDQVRPFNFLLSFQAKSKLEIINLDQTINKNPLWCKRIPNPASRYSTDLIHDQPEVFDRKTRQVIAWSYLKTVGRSLTRHHLHTEFKFQGGEDTQRGMLTRRHVHAFAFQPIGKEADNLEERQVLGEGDEAIEYEMSGINRKALIDDILALKANYKISETQIWTEARVSHHTLIDLKRGQWIDMQSLLNIKKAVLDLRQSAEQQADKDRVIIERLKREATRLGSVAILAKNLGVTRQYLGRILKGNKPMTQSIRVILI